MDFKSIGPFEGVVQIAAAQGDAHELLTDPANTAGAGPLTYHGGKVIDQSRGRFYNVYLGTIDFDMADFDAFTKAICEDGYYRSPDGADTSPCAFIGSTHITPYPFPSSVDDSLIGTWVDEMVSAGHFPKQDGFTMYSLIFPQGTTVTFGGSAASCSTFCGYHTRSSGANYYQVICDSHCPGCNQGVPNDGRMMIQAHELGEWRSDPDGTGWWNDQTGMENGDECAWNRVDFGPADKHWCVQPLAVNNVGCFVGTYKSPAPPPPPPPPPPPASSSMAMQSEPSNAIVGQKSAAFALAMLKPDGSLNLDDNISLVTASLTDAQGNAFTSADTGSFVAVKGIVNFPPATFKAVHSGMRYHFTCGGLTPIDSTPFDVTSAPPPPPPPTGDHVSTAAFSIPIIVNGKTYSLVVGPQVLADPPAEEA